MRHPAPFHERPLYKIAEAMRMTGNRPGIIAGWKNAVEIWAQNNKGPEADAIKAWLPYWHARPFYTAAELAPMFPALSLAFGCGKMFQLGPARMANELDRTRLPRLKNFEEYFIVERIHYWARKEITLKEFQEVFHVPHNG